MSREYWCSSSGRVELCIGIDEARACSHPGPCDADVAALREQPYIAEQLAAMAPDALRDELREYGAWDDAELADHDANLTRVLWLACCDIAEGAA